MSDGADLSPPLSDESDEQAQVLRTRAAALTPRERKELLEDVDGMLARLGGEPPE